MAALDGATAARLGAGLAAEGHAVQQVPAADVVARAADAATGRVPSAVLLGTARTRVAPTTRLAGVRAAAPALPVVVVATLPEGEVAAALRAGADDVVPDGVACGELALRLDAVWRRAREHGFLPASPHASPHASPPDPGAPRPIARGLALDDRRRAVVHARGTTPLTAREYGILVHLANHAGAAVTREALVRAVWPGDAAVDARSVDRHLATLRAKLGDRARRPTHVHTVRGVGYRLGGPAPATGAPAGRGQAPAARRGP